MTVTSNIHVGLSAWASQTYSAGQRVSNAGNAYQCVVPGSSTAAPTGTGTFINNGGVATWKRLSAIDYTTIQAWNTAWPATLVDNLVGQLWNDAVITTTAGTQILSTSGHTMGSFTATLTCAPGEGFRDTLRDNAVHLGFDTSTGVAIQLPNTTGNVNYFQIADANVVIDGIQFKDPISTSGSDFIGGDFNATGLIIRNCIFDGFGGSGSHVLSPGGADCRVINCLIIDRSNTLGNQTCNFFSETAVVVNCTFVNTNTSSSNNAIGYGSTTTGSIVRNCAFFNYTTPLACDTGSTVTVDHSVTDATTFAGSGITVGSGNLVSKTAANQFVNTSTDFRLKTGSDCINAGTTDTTDIPSADDIRRVARPQGSAWDVSAWELVTAPSAAQPVMVRGQQQEIPLQHPLSFFYPGGRGSNVRSPVADTVLVRQEQPASSHPLPALYGSFISVSTTTKIAVRRDLFTTQEQPRHPPPLLLAGRQGPNVRPWVTDTVVLQREQPAHPLPMLDRGVVPGPDVRTQIADTILLRQGQPVHPLPTFDAGIYGHGARNPGTDTIILRQEQPAHPLPTFDLGVPGATVRPPIVDTVILRQEQPPAFVSVTSAGRQGPNVRTQTADTVTTRQEQPGHPLPTLLSSLAGPNVSAPGVIGGVLTRQEQPAHPLSVLSSYRPDPPFVPRVLAGTSLAAGRQEQLVHPLPTLAAGRQGPDVRVAVLDYIITRQEQPPTFAPIAVSGPYGANVRPWVTDTFATRQEQPWHPSPSFLAGVQGPDVRSPTSDSILTRQEQPGHPLPSLLAGVHPRGVRTQITDTIYLRQEQPGHPLPSLSAGLQGPNVRPPISDNLLLRQEAPFHPLPTMVAGRQGPNVAPPHMIGSVILRQEAPRHPYPIFASGVATITINPSVTRTIFTQQERPGHPLPTVSAGVYINRPFVQGRTVSLIADL